MLGENALSAAKSLVELVPNCKSLRSLVGLKAIENAKNIELITDLKSAEKFLRDSGFSRTEAVAFMARVKHLRIQSDSDGGMQQIVEALKSRDKILA